MIYVDAGVDQPPYWLASYLPRGYQNKFAEAPMSRSGKEGRCIFNIKMILMIYGHCTY